MQRFRFVAGVLSSVGLLACDTFDSAPERKPNSPDTTPMLPPQPPPADTTHPLPQNCGAVFDRDGDGVTIVDISRCEPGTFVTDPSLQDCDDADSAHHEAVIASLDGDVDGYGGYGTSWKCKGALPHGYVTKTGDCDDADPRVHVLKYPDEDGDGQGRVARCATCVAEDAPGFGTGMDDCDDHDATRYFGAPGEVAYDGVDTDCDGRDVPWIVNDDGDELPSFDEQPWCDGPILAITAIGASDLIDRGVSLQVTNVGTRAVTNAELVLLSESTLKSWKIPDLEPGAIYEAPHTYMIGDHQAWFEYASAENPTGMNTGNTAAETSGHSAAPAPDVSPRLPRDGGALALQDGGHALETNPPTESASPDASAPRIDEARCKLLALPLEFEVILPSVP